MTATSTTGARLEGYARGQFRLSRRKLVNRLMLGLTGMLTLLALVPLFWIIGYVVYKGGSNLNLAFFTQMPRPLGMAGGGVLHAIQGTIVLTMLAGLFAIPPGLLAAIYVAQNPNTPLGVAVRFGTDVLAGVPSIVVGLFGYTFIVKQQRLCIARTIAIKPDIILMDEPASALDPIATLKIEELMRELAEDYTIIVVTHNMQQAARVSDTTAFFNMDEDRAGVLMEFGPTDQLFTNPNKKVTEDYITGRFG